MGGKKEQHHRSFENDASGRIRPVSHGIYKRRIMIEKAPNWVCNRISAGSSILFSIFAHTSSKKLDLVGSSSQGSIAKHVEEPTNVKRPC